MDEMTERNTRYQEHSREMRNGERCMTCGRPRGLEQPRGSWSANLPTVFLPRTDNPGGCQVSNDLIVHASIYRNGGTHERTHLCNECLRVGIRAIKVHLSELLDELDADHDKDAEIADLTARLASLQNRHHNVCFNHDRMQQRLAELLPHVADSADAEMVRIARWEAERKPAREADHG